MRADAARNRQVILAAAREVFAEHGVGTSLDVVADRAGVGIATLYRRFPDRGALVRAVVIEALEAIRGAAKAAGNDVSLPTWQSLLTAVGDLQLGLLMPLITARATRPKQTDDPQLDLAAKQTFELPQQILRAAQEAGSIRPDISSIDIHLLLATVTRPLSGVTPEYNREVARRNLRIVMDGLRSVDASQLPAANAQPDDLADMAEINPGE